MDEKTRQAIVGRVYIRFDGPPAHKSGRFIEVERDGASIKFGEWIQDGDDWLLVLPDGAAAKTTGEERIDRCIKEIIDWCKRAMPHFQNGPEFEVAKKFDDELHEICRRHIIAPRDDRPAPLWLAGEIVDFLNALVETDRDAVRALFNSRVPCNQKLADDPTVQVRAYGLEDKPHDFEVGILGLLNGFVGIDDDGCGLIQMVVDDEDEEFIEFRLAVE
jgi:hypothetical protein